MTLKRAAGFNHENCAADNFVMKMKQKQLTTSTEEQRSGRTAPGSPRYWVISSSKFAGPSVSLYVLGHGFPHIHSVCPFNSWLGRACKIIVTAV